MTSLLLGGSIEVGEASRLAGAAQLICIIVCSRCHFLGHAWRF
jgi:hypothetical protein